MRAPRGPVQVVLSFDQEGAKALTRALDKLPAKVQSKIVKQVMRPAAKPIMKEARRNLEKNQSIDTGALRDTLRVRVMRNNRRGYSGVVVMTGGTHTLAGIKTKTTGKDKGGKSKAQAGIFAKRTAKKIKSIVDSKYYYPAIVEYGAKRKDGTIIRAKPYMRPALASKRAEAMAIVNRLLWPLIDKAAAKLAKGGVQR